MNIFRILLLLITLGMGFSCGTLPPTYQSEPTRWENSDIAVEWVVGGKLYYLQIKNKTEKVIHISKGNCSFVGITGVTTTIDVPYLLPAKSRVIVYPMTTLFSAAFPGAGIQGNWGLPINYDTDPDFLRKYLNTSYRIGISYSIDSETKDLTIPILTTGVRPW